ncbi:hypothetical protein NXS19_007533 [Fusarium pseudograminearum]|nr:hypothetical protein NXS19_007533 [Fusarium pseudograminearum]
MAAAYMLVPEKGLQSMTPGGGSGCGSVKTLTLTVHQHPKLSQDMLIIITEDEAISSAIQICILDEEEEGEEGIARRDEMCAQCNPLNGPYGGEKELSKKISGRRR